MLLHTVLTNFTSDLFTTQIRLNPKPLFFQASHYFLSILCRRLGNTAHDRMKWRQPRRQGPRVVLNEHANKALEGTQNRAMQHDRCTTLVVGVNIFGAQALRHGKVYLDGATLPVTPDCIRERVLNLGAVEGSFTGRYFEFAAGATQAFHKGLLSFVPDLVGTDTFLGPCGHLIQDLSEAEVRVDLLQ